MNGLRRTLFVVFVVIVVIAVVSYWLSRRPEQLTGVEFSIDRSALRPGENATMTVNVENHDLKTHSVEYRFNASHRILVYEGAEKLLPRDGSEYVFNYTLGAADPSETKVFVAVGTLEEGVSSATYPICLTVRFDGEELEKTWNDIALKVEE